jgi:hypothetical protein
MLPFIGRPRRPKSARSHRNTVSSQRVPAQHNRNQAAHFRDRSGEERLNGCETCIKRRTPGLSVGCQWKQEKGEQ